MINNLYAEEEIVKDDCVLSNSHTLHIHVINLNYKFRITYLNSLL